METRSPAGHLSDEPGQLGRREDGALLTDIGCPDCAGVLAVSVRGDARHLVFTCKVGHAYSAESLLPLKEDETESTVWSTVELYEELVLLHRLLAERARADGCPRQAQGYERRAARAAERAAWLRQMLATDALATSEPEPQPDGAGGASS
jgi:two-component system chemotaxis response regulator CheB